MPGPWKFLIKFGLGLLFLYLLLFLGNLWLQREPAEVLSRSSAKPVVHQRAQEQVEKLVQKKISDPRDLPPEVFKGVMSGLLHAMQSYYIFHGEYPSKLTPNTLEELSEVTEPKRILKFLQGERIDSYSHGTQNFTIQVTAKGKARTHYTISTFGVRRNP